jgi:hypothetical protein
MQKSRISQAFRALLASPRMQWQIRTKVRRQDTYFAPGLGTSLTPYPDRTLIAPGEKHNMIGLCLTYSFKERKYWCSSIQRGISLGLAKALFDAGLVADGFEPDRAGRKKRTKSGTNARRQTVYIRSGTKQYRCGRCNIKTVNRFLCPPCLVRAENVGDSELRDISAKVKAFDLTRIDPTYSAERASATPLGFSSTGPNRANMIAERERLIELERRLIEQARGY